MSRTAALILACFVMLSGGLLAQAESVGQVRIGGIRLQYVDWGGSGAALVLVPGGCDTAFVFGDLAPRLVGDFHVLSLTARGCAGSDAATAGYGIDDQLGELAGFLDSQGIRRAVLAGHSSGGGKITRFARLFPERVERLVYFDTVYSFVAPGFEENMNAAIAKQLAPVQERSLERFRAIERAWELGVWSPAMERNATLTFNHSVPDDWWTAFRADTEAGRYFETTIRVPALMFFAMGLDSARIQQFDASTRATLKPLVDQTEMKRREQIETFRQSGPHVRIVEMSKTSHYCFAQRPDEIAEAIRAFASQRQ
jgi:pimeloyl-ACP methyl ester carboxylesterase